ETGDRGEVEARPTPRGVQVSEGTLAAEERPRQVDGDHPAPQGWRHLLDGRVAVEDAGRIDQGAEGTQRPHRLANRLIDVLPAADVGRYEARLAAAADDFVGDRPAAFGQQLHD